MDDKKFPIQDPTKYSLHDLNDVFSRFDAAYIGLGRTLGNFDNPPDFVRQCLGTGILPSLSTEGALRAQGEREAPTRVGKALNAFHTEMRNSAKKWGTYLAKDSAVRFHPPITKEMQEVLDYFNNYDTPEKITSYPKLLRDNDVYDVGGFVMDYFAKEVKSVTLQVPGGQPVTLPNIRVKKENGDSLIDDGAGAIQYEVPIAAMIWSVRAAGMSIKGRPQESPFRQFLETVIGTADSAGQTMVALQQWAPQVFQDYNREHIGNALHDQRYWIKLAYGATMIVNNNDTNQKAIADVLKLIGEDPGDINIKSADKVAVLLYVLAERMQTARNRLQSQVKRGERGDEPDIGSAITDPQKHSVVLAQAKRRLEEKHQDLTIDETITQLKQLAATLHIIGEGTERVLDEAKRNDGLHRPHDLVYYHGMTDGAFRIQETKTRALFQSQPKLIRVVEAAQKFEEIIKMDGVGMNPMGFHYANAALGFCRKQMTQTTSTERVSPNFFHPCA